MGGQKVPPMDLKSVLLIAAVVLAVLFAVKNLFPKVPVLSAIAGAVG